MQPEDPCPAGSSWVWWRKDFPTSHRELGPSSGFCGSARQDTAAQSQEDGTPPLDLQGMPETEAFQDGWILQHLASPWHTDRVPSGM